MTSTPNQPLILLQPTARETQPRTGGQWKGKMSVSSEFDAPDSEIESLFYDSPLLRHDEKKK